MSITCIFSRDKIMEEALSNAKLFGMVDSTLVLKEQDLTEKVIPYVDRQFALLLLNHAEKTGILSATDANAAKVQVLSSTFLIDALKEAGASSELVAQREQQLKTETEAVAAGSKEQAKLLYSQGNYDASLEVLAKLRDANSSDNSLLWGTYAANVMAGKLDKAAEDIPALQEMFDYKSGQMNTTPEAQLNMRMWFIHWALFSLFQVEGGSEKVCDLLLQSQFMCAIQASCPWLLRYLAIGVMTASIAKPRANAYQRRLRELVKVVLLEQYEYTDAVLDFVEALFVNFDFDLVATKLELAIAMVKNDYFTNQLSDAFIQSARFHIIDLYFKVHDDVDVAHLAPILSLSVAETQELLSEFLADSKLECSPTVLSNGTYKTNRPKQSILSIVKEKTRAIEARSKQALAQAETRNEPAN